MCRAIVVSLLLAGAAAWIGCGQQNEFLAEAKDLLKSDKRNRIPLAVSQLERALDTPLSPRDSAETHYLIGYYEPDFTAEERAAHFTQAIQEEPKRYQEALVQEAIRDREVVIRDAVRLALAERYRTDKRRIRKLLLEALEGGDNRSRTDAAWVLGYLAAQDSALIADIKESLNHRRMRTRLNSVVAVEELAKHDQSAGRQFVPLLMEKINAKPQRVWWKFWNTDGEREDPEVRALCVVVLGSMGATDEILSILRNKGSSLRSNAMDALIESGGGEAAIDALLALLDEQEAGASAWNSSQRHGRRIARMK